MERVLVGGLGRAVYQVETRDARAHRCREKTLCIEDTRPVEHVPWNLVVRERCPHVFTRMSWVRHGGERIVEHLRDVVEIPTELLTRGSHRKRLGRQPLAVAFPPAKQEGLVLSVVEFRNEHGAATRNAILILPQWVSVGDKEVSGI